MSKYNNNGFSLIEILFSVAVFSLFITAFIGTFLYTQETVVFSGNRVRAMLFAMEGVDAVKNIRDRDFDNLEEGVHGISINNNKWELFENEDLFDVFKRTVEISSINDDKKEVVVSVLWNEGQRRSEVVSFKTYLTNWMKEVLTEDPLGYWPLDENSGCIASDIYNNHDGILSPECGINSPEWTTGKINSALFFNGIDDMVIVDDSHLINPTSGITVSAWIKWDIDPQNGNEWTTIINKNGDRQYRLQHNRDNSLFEFAIRTSSGGRWVVSDTSPEEGVWYHLAGTYDGSIMKIYVDGVLENSTLWDGSIDTSGSPLIFGNRIWGDRGFNGVIDEIGLWGRALSSTEIEELYMEGENGESGIESCHEYCVSISYSSGTCRQNPRQCTNNNETYESGGDVFCPGPPQRDCCCN